MRIWSFAQMDEASNYHFGASPNVKILGAKAWGSRYCDRTNSCRRYSKPKFPSMDILTNAPTSSTNSLSCDTTTDALVLLHKQSAPQIIPVENLQNIQIRHSHAVVILQKSEITPPHAIVTLQKLEIGMREAIVTLQKLEFALREGFVTLQKFEISLREAFVTLQKFEISLREPFVRLQCVGFVCWDAFVSFQLLQIGLREVLGVKQRDCGALREGFDAAFRIGTPQNNNPPYRLSLKS